ncbi:MAG: CsiV family protein [Halieaceae bacterium]|jgi:hypothetical protein|nr:CsiV family protein [Halieaceae bacterium]
MIPKLYTLLTASALALLAAFPADKALAQDYRWFKVELLVFTNQAPPAPQGAASAEQWDATPELAYPLATRFLVDPARVARNEARYAGNSLIDEYGRQIITITSGTGGGQIQAPTPVIPEPAPVETGDALPRPFVTLADGYREFSGKASALQRSGRHSVLFHEAWVQAVGPEANSLPIVLDHSGDEQQWPPLQGTIKIYLTRYLHLETNLWLNTAGDYLPGTWKMPAPPFGPPSLIIEEDDVVDIAAAIESLPAADSTAPEADAAAVGEAAVIEEAQGPVYPYRHAVLLEQTRRMRSGETHYIDHPLLGVIIRFTPVSGEELAAIAASQTI